MKKHLVMCLCVILCSVTLMACKGGTDNSYKTNSGSEEYSTAIMQTEALEEAEENVQASDNELYNDTDISESKEEQIEEAVREYGDRQRVYFDASWQYGDNAVITDGSAVMYKSSANPNGIVVAVNAGHGTVGGTTVKTLCHPDGSAKTTGGTTAQGATMAVAVSSGMTFNDGVAESYVTLRMAEILRDALLDEGFDVLMIRDEEDVQLDNVARTVMANNIADCHIALHWDSDGLSYDKGCFYIAVPEALKSMEPVTSHWQDHNALGEALIGGLKDNGIKLNGQGSMAIDLTQTSYSTIPSVDIELGNSCSDHSDSTLDTLKDGLVQGIKAYFNIG
jgi:N-acetylmuramoyl-L-alanine amidase